MTEPEVYRPTPEELAESQRSTIVERRLLHSRPGSERCIGRDHEVLTLTTKRANGCSGPTVAIVWIRQGGFKLGRVEIPQHLAPRVEMFSDTWIAFTELRDVFDLLATFDSWASAGVRATVEEVKAALLGIGFVESHLSNHDHA
jgi:hypothetical protein